MARQPDNTADAKFKSSDSALIRELALLLDETNLTEIEIERAGLRGRVARQILIAPPPPPPRATPPRLPLLLLPPTSPNIRARCPRRWSAPPIWHPNPAPSRSSKSAPRSRSDRR